MLTIQSFFDLSDFPHPDIFSESSYVWSPLNSLKEYLDKHIYPAYDNQLIKDGIPLKEHIIIYKGIASPASDCKIVFGNTTKHGLEIHRSGKRLSGATLLMAGSVLTGKRISIGKGVLVEGGATIKSPTVIGDFCEVRQGAYLRGYVLAGKRCVLGHTTEIKHSIFLNDAKAGHFAYVGDSILGNNANLGAGTKFANLKFLPGNISFFFEEKRIDTGRRKFGAILGDNGQTGCNSVTSPGTIMGKRSILLPNTTARGGYHPANSILR